MIEEKIEGCAVPTGLIVFPCTYPGSELPGYSRTSLWDENVLLRITSYYQVDSDILRDQRSD